MSLTKIFNEVICKYACLLLPPGGRDTQLLRNHFVLSPKLHSAHFKVEIIALL